MGKNAPLPAINSAEINSSLKNVWQNTPALVYNMYSPKNTSANNKLIICIHPGGFTGGKIDFDKSIVMANTFAPLGYTVVSPQYTLASDSNVNFATILAAVLDCNNFLAFMLAKQQWQKIYVFGASAGAMIADVMACADQSQLTTNINSQKDKIDGLISCWGSMDPAYVANTKAPVALFHGYGDPTIYCGTLKIYGSTSSGGVALKPDFEAIGLTKDEWCHLWYPKDADPATYDWSWPLKDPGVHGCDTDFFIKNIIPPIQAFLAAN